MVDETSEIRDCAVAKMELRDDSDSSSNEGSKRHNVEPGHFFKGLKQKIKKGIEKTIEKGEEVTSKDLKTRIKERIHEHRKNVMENQTAHQLEKSRTKESIRHSHMKESSIRWWSSHENPVKVASLHISELAIREAPKAIKHHTYLAVTVETNRETTSRLSPSAEKKQGRWDDTLNFDLHDIGADVILSVYGKSHEKVVKFDDKFLGKVVIPLSRIYGKENVVSLFDKKNRCFELESWFKVYPLKQAQRQFDPVIPGIPGTGMERVKDFAELRVKMRIELEDGYSLFRALSSNPPFKPVGELDLDEFSPKKLKLGVSRLKHVKKMVIDKMANLESIQSWERPTVTCIFLAWWTYLCLVASPFQYPALLAIFYVGLQIAFPYEDFDVEPLVWNDEIEKDPDLPDTIPKKLKMVQKLVLGLQKVSNKVAFHLERTLNACNSSDKFISVIFCLYLVVLGFAVSLIVAAIQFLCYLIVPFHVAVYCIGISLLLPRSTSSLPPSIQPTESESKAQKDSKEHETKSSTNSQRLKELVQSMRCCSSNLVARIPDANELIHRKIARTQELEK